jgi:hypothetical protein
MLIMFDFLANLNPPLKLFRLVIIYTRFASIYSRLHPFENAFLFLYQRHT